jgi:hypothetical protein
MACICTHEYESVPLSGRSRRGGPRQTTEMSNSVTRSVKDIEGPVVKVIISSKMIDFEIVVEFDFSKLSIPS